MLMSLLLFMNSTTENWIAWSIFFKNQPKNNLNICCRSHYLWSRTKNRSKDYKSLNIGVKKVSKVNERNLCRKYFHGSQHFLLKFTYAKFFKISPVKVKLYTSKLYSSNRFNRNCFIEMSYYELSCSFSSSNLRKPMSVNCKNVTIWPKNFMFYRNTAYDMQVARRTVN